jgi:hypothetical protein
MLHLLDANVLITAHSLYYPVDVVPQFWEWLAQVGQQGLIKMPQENYDEVKDGGDDESKDLLFAWVKDAANRAALRLNEAVDPALLQRVLDEGYGTNLTEVELEQIGRDPFLIAYALASAADRIVVTTEVSKPGRVRQNRHVPDVCKTMGVQCCDPFVMLKALKFSAKK